MNKHGPIESENAPPINREVAWCGIRQGFTGLPGGFLTVRLLFGAWISEF
jgi:hypothetical protein